MQPVKYSDITIFAQRHYDDRKGEYWYRITIFRHAENTRTINELEPTALKFAYRLAKKHDTELLWL